MQRREFIVAIGGAAAWPIAAQAQQAVSVRRVAALSGWSEKAPEAQADAAVFRRELEKLGWIEKGGTFCR